VAYLTYLAVVPAAEITRLREDSRYVLRPLLVQGVSHLLSYWVQVQPLGQILNTIIDGGDTLQPELWHPLRSPRVHDADQVLQLTESLESALREISLEALPDGDWLSMEVARLLVALQGAVEAGACLVTALEPPADVERACRVRIPWTSSAVKTPLPQRKWWRFW
jgi:hypothetical protein